MLLLEMLLEPFRLALQTVRGSLVGERDTQPTEYILSMDGFLSSGIFTEPLAEESHAVSRFARALDRRVPCAFLSA